MLEPHASVNGSAQPRSDRILPLHVAIILDGNGRWALERGLARPDGHRAGVDVVRQVVEAAPMLGVGTLTLFAFSSDNWRRPASEVRLLLRLLTEFLEVEVERFRAQGVRATVIGRRDRLPARFDRAAQAIETATRGGRTLHLRLAIDYSAREAIVRAARRLHDGLGISQPCFHRLLAEAAGERSAAPDVDLLIRTGGEQRLSDFLLWECAYAELWFTPTPWPEFTVSQLGEALRDFEQRERRFGTVSGRICG